MTMKKRLYSYLLVVDEELDAVMLKSKKQWHCASVYPIGFPAKNPVAILMWVKR